MQPMPRKQRIQIVIGVFLLIGAWTLRTVAPATMIIFWMPNHSARPFSGANSSDSFPVDDYQAILNSMMNSAAASVRPLVMALMVIQMCVWLMTLLGAIWILHPLTTWFIGPPEVPGTNPPPGPAPGISSGPAPAASAGR